MLRRGDLRACAPIHTAPTILWRNECSTKSAGTSEDDQHSDFAKMRPQLVTVGGVAFSIRYEIALYHGIASRIHDWRRRSQVGDLAFAIQVLR